MSLDDFVDRYTNISSLSVSIDDFIEKYKIYAYLEGEKIIRKRVIKELKEEFGFMKNGNINIQFYQTDNIFHEKIRTHLKEMSCVFLENVQVQECNYDFVFRKSNMFGQVSFYFIKISYVNPEYIDEWKQTEEYKFATNKGWYLNIHSDFIEDYYELYNKITKITNTNKAYTSRQVL